MKFLLIKEVSFNSNEYYSKGTMKTLSFHYSKKMKVIDLGIHLKSFM